MEINDRTEIFQKLEEFYNSNEKYKKLLKYYKKVWLNNSYLNYSELTEKEYLNRTNNYLEYFHHILNTNIEVFYPNLSYLIEKYKSLISSLYNKIKESIVKDIGEKKTKVQSSLIKYLKNAIKTIKINRIILT